MTDEEIGEKLIEVKEKLGEFIRSFYWQSSKRDSKISYLEGEKMADRNEAL